MAKKSFSRLVNILAGVHTGAETEFTRLERFARFWVLVGRSFVRNRCPLRAAALSYTTLLALIPLLAVAISVTSSLLKNQGEEQIYSAVDKLVSALTPPATLADTTNGVVALKRREAEAEFSLTNSANSLETTNSISLAANDTRVEAAQKVVARNIHEFIKNTRSGTLGVIGMLLLVYVAIRMLASIESTFNDIWGVLRGRNWLRRIVLYWTTITLGPLLIVGALGLAGGPHLQSTKNLVSQMPLIGGFVFKILPPMVICLAFTLVYIMVPNTRVRPGAAFIGGIVGGSLWHLNNAVGFLYVSRVVNNSKIYGSLGLLPVFMVGLYISWLILLFGAQVAYAWQNRQSYLQDKFVETVNQRGREFIALRLITLIGMRFQQGEAPASLQQISSSLGIPTRLVQQVLQPLLTARLVTELAGTEPAYLPARPLEAITAHHVLRAVRAGSGQELVTRDEAGRAEVLGEFAKIEEAERAAASSVTLLALVNRTRKQIEDAPGKNDPS
jgi:membrane protein